ncbi:MAG: ADP-ribosylglycohydrolase family protein, partial [Coleofasciculus sp. Co-bin14]|nr:ADP-ribosylglycohydrolase family protein [Coleofasciculus sp. Co-bin14]
DKVKLRQQLLQAADLWQQEPNISEGALAVAFAIALALTEKLNVTTLIPQTLAYLEISQTPLVHQLEQVQTLLEQGAGLDRTLTQLHREVQRPGTPSSRPYIPIALAFYCFLSTPEDFRLCVSRAVRTGHQSQITAALTGALAGVYNSIIGIPVSWRLAADRMSNTVGGLQQADRLLAVWSGVYDVSSAQHCPWTAVAAPQVIQPR